VRQPFAILAALTALGFASGAAASNAWSWTPANSAIAGTGTMAWSINGQPVVDCNVAMTGQTAAKGALQITSLTFTDTGDGTCTDVSSPLEAHPQRWNPVLSSYARWGVAKFYLAPKGLRCYGNTGMKVEWTDGGGDTMVYIDAVEASGSGSCHVTGAIDIGAVTIAPTPPE
jgi:hypothetical protein